MLWKFPANAGRQALAMLPADAGLALCSPKVLRSVLGPNKVHFLTGLGNLGIHQQL